LDTAPIEFAVKGEGRDWTFITSSLLEERALKIRRPSLRRYLGVRTEWELFVYFFATLGGLMVLILFISNRPHSYDSTTALDYLRNPSPSQTSTELPFSEEFETILRNENIKDPIQAMLARDKLLEKREKEREEKESELMVQRSQELQHRFAEINQQDFFSRNIYIVKFILFVLTPPLLLYLIRTFLVLFYPTYNFCWGDYLDIFRRKESVRKFVIVVIFIGVIVSFIGGVLANYTKIGK
jgi:hypothetical protein